MVVILLQRVSPTEESVIVKPPNKLNGFKSIFFSNFPLALLRHITRQLLQKSFYQYLVLLHLVLWSELLSKPDCVFDSLDISLAYYSKSNGRTSKASLLELLFAFFCAALISGLSKPEAFLSTLLYLYRGIVNKLIRPYFELSFSITTNLSRGFSFLRLISRVYYYISQSFLFDLRYRVNTFMRRKFDSSIIHPKMLTMFTTSLSIPIFS